MNVLFMMADEMGGFALGPPEMGRLGTPRLLELAADGLRFDAAYTPSPICVPARASIATGRYLHEIGYWSSAEPYDGRVEGWGHRLLAAGCEVVSFGKLHFRNAKDATGFSRQVMPTHVVDGIGWPPALLRQDPPPYGHSADLAHDIGIGETVYTSHDRHVTNTLTHWLAEPARHDAPWCAFVSWFSPHYPLMAPEEHFEPDPEKRALARWMHQPMTPPRDGKRKSVRPDHPVLRRVHEFFDHDRHFTSETAEAGREAYFALCNFIDAQVAEILVQLERSGLAENTLVIFTADHGEMLGAHGFWAKSTMYEESVRVPLVLAGPGITPAVREDPVSLIDLAPTILEAMEVPGSEGFPGHSLLAPPLPDRTVLSEYHDGGAPVGMFMARWGDWKYVHYAGGHPAQLFNLRWPAGESHDHALTVHEADTLAEGRRRLFAILDPEAVDARAKADQSKRLAELGGREAILARQGFHFTPPGSG